MEDNYMIMKLIKSGQIEPIPSEYPGCFSAQVPKGDSELRSQYKQLGGFWDPESRIWTFPIDMYAQIAILLNGEGYDLKDPRLSFSPSDPIAVPSPPYNFRQYQTDGYLFALETLQERRGVLLRHDTGMGKTFLTIALHFDLYTASLFQDKNDVTKVGINDVLIVCGASGLSHWRSQIDKYWGLGHEQDWDPDYLVAYDAKTKKRHLDTGNWQTDKSIAHILLCSYSMLHHVQLERFGLMVFDEIHALQDLRTRQGKAAEQLVNSGQNRKSFKIGLSATPIKDKPDDIHGPWSILLPKQVQSWTNFVGRYMINEPNQYQKYNLVGIKPEMVQELSDRISGFTHTATKKEWADLLPKIIVDVVLCKANFIGKNFDVNDMTQFMQFLEVSKDVKTLAVLAQCDDWFLEGADKILIGVYHHKHAGQLAETLSKTYGDVTVTSIDEQVITKRHRAIDVAVNVVGKSILVVTMKANSQTIDSLNIFKNVIIAELSYEPTVIEQFLGRVGRNSDDVSEGVIIKIIAVENTIDQVQAEKLVLKIENNELIMESTHGGELIRDNMAFKPKEDVDILEETGKLLFAMDNDLYGDDL